MKKYIRCPKNLCKVIAMEAPKNYFKHQKTILWMLGISLENTHLTVYYKVYSCFVAATIVISHGVLEVFEAFYNFSNLDALVGVVSYLATDLIGLVKLFILLYYREEITHMLQSFESGVFLPNLERGGEYEVEVLKRCVLMSNWQSFIFQLFCLIVLSFGIVGTITERILNNDDPTKWKMPFLSFSLFRIDQSPNYEIAWFYQSFMRFMYSGIVTSADTLLGAILAHVSAQCLMLQNSIRRITLNSNGQKGQSLPHGILHARLKSVVHYHWSILRLAENFEKFFSNLILCEFLGTLCILCLSMFHASMYNLFSRQAAQDFFYFATIAIQVLLCCFWGNEVTLQSQAMANSYSEADFVGTDVRFQKDLIFVIRKCQKPIILTAGRFVNLSMATYVWILRASYSYYMVLRNNN